jgi:hypothetical protein
VDADGSRTEPSTGRPLTGDRALLWVPPLLFAAATWAVFREAGWLAWLAAIPAAYVGRAAGDLATAGSHRIEGGVGRG